MGEWLDGWMNGCIYVCMVGWRMDEWMDRWMDWWCRGTILSSFLAFLKIGTRRMGGWVHMKGANYLGELGRPGVTLQY